MKKLFGTLLACLLLVLAMSADAAGVCQTENDVLSALQTAARRGDRQITINFNKNLYDTLYTNGRYYELFYQAGLCDWHMTISRDGVLTVRDAAYHKHFKLCNSQYEAESFIRDCVSKGWTDFAFYYKPWSGSLTHSELTTLLRTNGLKTWSYTTSSHNCHAVTGAQFLRNFRQCSTLYEVISYVRSCCDRQLTSISFSYPANAGNLPKHYFDLMYNCGFWDGDGYHYSDERIISIENITYRTGYKIVRARANGTTGSLSSQERQVYDKAQSIVQAARRTCRTDFQFAKYFNDYLCSTVTYQSAPEGTVYDTATGALLYNKAECDGYADAFYLLCSLAGVEVAFQHGDAGSSSDTSHLWNVLKINGSWHFVDVTWDDLDWSQNKDLCTYRYFNVGSFYMPEHVFKKDLCVVTASSGTDWDYFVYTAPESTGIETGVYSSNVCSFVNSWYKHGRRNMHLMVEGNLSQSAVGNLLKKGITLRGVRWNYYYYSFDKYTLIDLYIRPN